MEFEYVKFNNTLFCVIFLGIQDPASVKPVSTLSDLGMDSLMGVDIKQSIERSCGLSLTNTQIQQLKFSELDKVGAK